MRPPIRSARGGDGRMGRSGGGGGRGGGRSPGGARFGGARGGGRSFQRDEGPPAEIVEAGAVVHECESELLCRWTLDDKVPHFNAGVYLENKRKIGKVDEILGKISEIFFTVKMEPGVLSKSFQPKDLLYIGMDKLLPLSRFTNPSSGGARGGSRGGGRGVGRGGGRGRSPSGRGGRSPGGRSPGGRFGGARMGAGRSFSRGGRTGGRGR